MREKEVKKVIEKEVKKVREKDVKKVREKEIKWWERKRLKSERDRGEEKWREVESVFIKGMK